MNKRQNLGQHFLTSQVIASKIVQSADVSANDVVLEIGTGLGILIPKMCQNAKKVISIEADRSLYLTAKQSFDFDNLELICDDGFKTNKKFSVFISNLPYSKSKTAIEWLSQRRFFCAIIMVQSEFADKLFENNRAVAIIANYCFEIQKIIKVGRNNFSPVPKVDSVVLRLIQKHTLSYDIIKTINLMFSYRRKTVSNVLKKFNISNDSKLRLEDLSGDDIINIAKQISKQ